MGLFKRLFSFGSKKNKKRQPTPEEPAPPIPTPSVDEEQRRKLEEEEHEAAVGRLLRSSSSRYAIVKEIDYTDLPPLPHPINDVLANCVQTPAHQERSPSLRLSPSTASLASSTLSRQSTFSVTVHGRQRHAETEFPNANGDLSDDLKTPTQKRSKRQSHQLGLRSDPSVSSLIEMYDEHGRLPAEAFSNSPPSPERHGRPQKKRGGSTLRELLGAPDSLNSKGDSNVESDISWAERFLGEAESCSSHTSSYGPDTPSDSTHDSTDRTENPKARELNFSTDMSPSTTDDPAITSMEVELSLASAESSSAQRRSVQDISPYVNADPNTPQRASQVFSFLTKRGSHPDERTPSRISFGYPSDTSNDCPRSHFSTDSSFLNHRQVSRRGSGLSQDNSRTPVQRKAIQRTPHSQARRKVPVSEVHEDECASPAQRKVRVLMTGPTKIMVTAPTPNTNNGTPSRIPVRGPRQPPTGTKRRASASRRTSAPTHRTNSAHTSSSFRGFARSREQQNTNIPQRKRRTPSQTSGVSASSSQAEADAMATVCVMDQLARSKTYSNASPSRSDKENLAANMELPSTPLRSHTTGRQALFRKAVTPNLFQPPAGITDVTMGMVPSGGNSSSELSPLGKQMMIDARRQRKRPRESALGERRLADRNGRVVGPPF